MKTNQHLDFDVGILADKTVEKLGVGAGKVIWIWASVHLAIILLSIPIGETYVKN
jgi:hypothetical protein